MFPLPRQRKPFYGLIAFLLTLSMTAYSVAKADDVAPVEKGSAPRALEEADDLVLVEDAGPPRALEGKEIFESRCAACHGVDGRGDPGRQLLKIDLPDFTDCSFASREPDSDFAAVIHGGGPARGFSILMPVWRAALSQAEIARVLSHLRSFCSDERWPRGELKLPRPLLTEKAFPEDEVVVTTFANVNRDGLISSQLLFEKRIGSRAMVEVVGVADLGGTTELNRDIVPQIQTPLHRRQHVRMNVGVWIPATRNDERATRVGAYLLWDWFDGGLFEGW